MDPKATTLIFLLAQTIDTKIGGFGSATALMNTRPAGVRFGNLFPSIGVPTHGTTMFSSGIWAERSASSSSSDQDSGRRASTAVNVLGTALEVCCSDVRGTGIGTGFYRDGCCTTGEQDVGRHTVCVQVTSKFLEYSKRVGNDLSTPVPQYLFPGLKEGDVWCLCAQRWVQAYENGVAPMLVLRATHEKTLTYVPFEVLREYAIDRDESDAKLEELNELRSRLNDLL